MILRAWWQPLTSAWYMSLYNRSDEPIALGRQVAPRRRLIKASEFDGELVVVPLVDDASSVGRDAWRETHALVYFNPSEVEQVAWVL